MLRIKDIFLRKLAWVFVVFFVVLGVSIYFWIRGIYINETKKNLNSNINMLIENIKNIKNINLYIKNMKKNSGITVTITDNSGKIVATNNENEITKNSHKVKENIMHAKNRKEKYDIHYSNTLKKDLIHITSKVEINNTIYHVQMARDIDDNPQSFIFVSVKIIILFVLFTLFAYRMIIGIGSDIQKETRKILNFLDGMGGNDKNRQINSNYSVEFKKITKLLTETSKKLYKKRKQKNKYTAKLKIANIQKDDIISAISHEFKNPIAVISGYSQTLMDDKNISPALLERFLQKISINANKLSDMIDRIRLFIKLDKHKYNGNFTDIDMAKIIQNAIETMQISYPDRNIEFVSNGSAIIRADKALMEIAVTNLIENAIKYSKDTPIKIELDNSSIKVIDEGIGIPESEIDKITKKFYRVNNHRWNNSIGIGLSIVANILSIHNFSLYIDSKEDEGSTFEIRFAILKA